MRKKLINIESSQRKSPRLSDYNYSTEGVYFITICVKDKMKLLGKICYLDNADENTAQMTLSAYGIIVKKYIERIPGLQKYVIMPNHIHLLIEIAGENELAITQRISSLKTLITKELGVSIFQRSFHDHIVRNEKEYQKIWEYIDNNPLNWTIDCFYKDNGGC